MDKPNLSLVVPCYNEEQRIPRFESLWGDFLRDDGARLFKLFPKIEIILIDDGSKDQTKEMLAAACQLLTSGPVTARYESLPKNMGKGAAVKRGFQLSEGDWVLMTDVDLSSPLRELFHLVNAQVEFALGSRALAESRVVKKQGGGRPSLGRLFNFFTRMVTGIPFMDTQCGFKLFSGNLARRIGKDLIEKRFAFDVELVQLANRLSVSMAEVPVEWAHQEPSRVVLWKDGIHMLYRVMALTQRYGRWRKPLTF